MELSGITWSGPPIDDAEIVAELPRELRGVLEAINGFILFGGALHVRGAVHDPPWHSLRHAWRGAESLSALYPAVQPEDVPFAQDCVGDQFLLRGGSVLQLQAETGEVEDTGLGLFTFLERACADPDGSLSPEPLLRHQADAGELAPRMLLHAYPPFCTAQAAGGVSLMAVPALELIRFHADFARQIADVPPGGSIEIRITD
jgi:hypothetical protein